MFAVAAGDPPRSWQGSNWFFARRPAAYADYLRHLLHEARGAQPDSRRALYARCELDSHAGVRGEAGRLPIRRHPGGLSLLTPVGRTAAERERGTAPWRRQHDARRLGIRHSLVLRPITRGPVPPGQPSRRGTSRRPRPPRARCGPYSPTRNSAATHARSRRKSPHYHHSKPWRPICKRRCCTADELRRLCSP